MTEARPESGPAASTLDPGASCCDFIRFKYFMLGPSWACTMYVMPEIVWLFGVT